MKPTVRWRWIHSQYAWLVVFGVGFGARQQFFTREFLEMGRDFESLVLSPKHGFPVK